ncbi:glutamine-hydrolyzing GMP synthase [bacterium]|nr:glutamine-hydrolyzing GMP synthase [bacterium]
MAQKILIVDYGSQYTQLILKNLRHAGYPGEIVPFNRVPTLNDPNIRGIILAGGPRSVYEKNAPTLPDGLFDIDVPILGICYGFQLLCSTMGGETLPGNTTEYGSSVIEIKNRSMLFSGIDQSRINAWMSHSDEVKKASENFTISAVSENGFIVAVEDMSKKIFGVQFHPEVTHTQEGTKVLGNFLKMIDIQDKWDMDSRLGQIKADIAEKTNNERVALAISGGVDSTVLAVLLKEVIGDRLIPIFVDNGLLRKNEARDRMEMFASLGLNVKCIDSSTLFVDRLQGVVDPEEKRKIIGKTFIEVFEKELKGSGVRFLGQGTLYPDVIESTPVYGQSSKIKLHHNVGGLPEKLNLDLVEPFRYLFKDEVRELGKLLNVPSPVLDQHPFPGPGLAVRIIGAVNEQRLELLKEIDDIFISELKSTGLYEQIWQSLAVLVPVKSTGVKGDVGISEHLTVLRAVTSVDGMTADWFEMPSDFLKKVSSMITNRVKGINRVVYDITSKPPATIEWE